MAAALVEVIRGSVVEGIHMGHIVVVDTLGRIIHSLGNPQRVTFFRSAAKPLLAIAVLKTGIMEKFNLSLREIALIASSHSGEPRHVEVLKSIMEKTSIKEEQLECGVHDPLNREAAQKLYAKGTPPTSIHCNCSGKHLGLMAAIKTRGFDTENYYLPQHPIYKELESVISDFTGVEEESIIKSTDGCGIPVYGVPLAAIARAYANLSNTEFMDGKYAKEQDILIRAMTGYPEMVGGEKRLDTALLSSFGDRLVSKMGAEGLHCISFIKSKLGSALKIEDGSLRAVDPSAVELLLQLGVVSQEEASTVAEYHYPPVLNHRKEKVGELLPVFRLRN